MAALPAVAWRLSRAGDAYEHFAESIRDWPSREELARRIAGAGWSAVRGRDLTLGVVTVHASNPGFGLVRTRRGFDETLARAAPRAGARLLEGVTVTGPVLDDATGWITGVTGKPTFSGGPAFAEGV